MDSAWQSSVKIPSDRESIRDRALDPSCILAGLAEHRERPRWTLRSHHDEAKNPPCDQSPGMTESAAEPEGCAA